MIVDKVNGADVAGKVAEEGFELSVEDVDKVGGDETIAQTEEDGGGGVKE